MRSCKFHLNLFENVPTDKRILNETKIILKQLKQLQYNRGGDIEQSVCICAFCVICLHLCADVRLKFDLQKSYLLSFGAHTNTHPSIQSTQFKLVFVAKGKCNSHHIQRIKSIQIILQHKIMNHQVRQQPLSHGNQAKNKCSI